MKTNLFKVFNLTAIIFFISISFAQAQVTGSGSGLRNIQPDNSGEEKYNQIADDAGRFFKEGLMSLQDNRRAQAREKFDKSVEVFLSSGVNVRSNAKLQSCYSQLIETVYRIEFPSQQQQAQIRALSQTCGWNIDNQLADNIVKLSLTPVPNETTATNSNDKNLAALAAPQVGFAEQGYKVQLDATGSPLDELAKLELTPEEKDIDGNPIAQQQLEYARVAVANKSLGFSFQVHPMIQQFINFYQGRGRGTMETGLYRSGMFMRMARRIFREEGVPENVAWLAQVESTWKPSALSWASASGLWQFIPGTGARYGLQRTAYIDERNSFEKATRASAQYLKFLANRYGGNWELAMAAYNSGEGNVDRYSPGGSFQLLVSFPVSAAGNTQLCAKHFGDYPDCQQSESIRFRTRSPGAATGLRADSRSVFDRTRTRRTGFGHERRIPALPESRIANQHYAARTVCHPRSDG